MRKYNATVTHTFSKRVNPNGDVRVIHAGTPVYRARRLPNGKHTAFFSFEHRFVVPNEWVTLHDAR